MVYNVVYHNPIFHILNLEVDCMKCWKRFGALALTAALTLSLSVLPAHAATFSDTENHWSRGVVEDLYEKGITRGYEDGTFRPEGTMSAVEGLLFCTRMAGIDPKIQNQIYKDRKEEVDKRMPSGYVSWAAQELAVAVELGILTLDELEDLSQTAPNSINSSAGPTPYLGWNIPREQFCMYVVRAMQLEPMAQSLSIELCTSYLNAYFVDAEEITPAYRPYVYILRNYNILNGEAAENGGSQVVPSRNLKRSETAALISRAISFMEENGLYAEAFEYTTYPWAAGTIQDSSSNPDGTVKLTLSNSITGNATYTLPSDVVVYDEYNMPGDTRNLINGQYVRLIMDEVDKQIVSARLCGQVKTLEGRVVTLGEESITLWVNGQSQTLPYSRFTQFKAGGNAGGASVLEPEAGYTQASCYVDSKGTLVGVSLSGGTVQREGIISAVTTAANGTTLTLTDANGVGTDYVIASDVPVTVNGGSGNLAVTHVGRPATLRVGEEDNKVASVSVDTMTLYIQGPIRSQGGTSSARTVTIANWLDNKREISYTLAPSVVITYDGQSRTVNQIENGWFATAKVVGGMITDLTAYSATVQVEGILSEIKYDATVTTLSVALPDGGIQTYELDMTYLPDITREGKTSTLAQLRKGDSLTITLRYHTVETITAKAQEADLKGEITEISQTSAGTTVKIKLTDGTESSYTASGNVTVTKDGKALTYRDLSYGDQIAFIANGTELVTVEILSTSASASDTMLNGQVLSIDTRGNNRLMYLLVPGVTDPVEVNLRNASSIQDLSGRTLSLISGGLKAGDTVTVFGTRNGAVFEAKMVVKTSN